MKKIFSILAFIALIMNANAQFQTTDSIANNNCRIEFYNSNRIKIYEMIANNLTWWKQSNGAFVIRDRVTQVTLSTTFSGFPALSNMEDSLNNWIVNCQGCCDSGGGASVGLNTFQFSDGSGGFFEVNDTIIDEGDTTLLYIGLGSGMASIVSGANNAANGDISVAIGSGNQSNGIASVAMGGGNIVRPVAGLGLGINIEPDMTADTLVAAATDEVFQIGSGFGAGNALSVNRIGVLKHKGAYANTGYVFYGSGGSTTIPDNVSYFIYNPASTQASATITMPESPYDGQVVTISFGGSITSGTVVTSLLISPNTAQSIVKGSIGTTGLVEQPFSFIWCDPIDTWFLISH